LSVSQDTSGEADHFSGAVPALRSRICTLYGSPSRWFTETKNPPEAATVGELAGADEPLPSGAPSPVACAAAPPLAVVTVTDSRSWLGRLPPDGVWAPPTTSLGCVLSR